MIYVGATGDLRTRMKAHAAAAWWLDVDQSTITAEAFPDERAAAQAERTLIRLHQPRHNRAGVVGAYIPYRAGRRRGPRGQRTPRADEVLARLRALVEEWEQRPRIIDEARSEKATWQEIADALHMTAHGARKLHATLPASERRQ